MSDPNAPAGPPEPVEPVPPQPPEPSAGDYAPPPPPPAPPPAAPPTPPAAPPGDYSAPPPPPPPPGYGTPAAAGVPAAADAPFAVGDAFSWGWKKFTENVGPILLAMVVYFVIAFIVEVIWFLVFRSLFVSQASITVNQQTGQITTDAGSGFFSFFFVQALSTFAFVVLSAFLQAAVIRGGLILARGEKLEIGHMFVFDNFGTVLLAAIIVGALTAVGFLVCFVGSIVVWFFTTFYLFFVVDKRVSAWDSVKASFELVKNNMGHVALLILAVIGANIVGAILCGIGLIVSLPVSFLALTYGYRRLQGDPVAA